MKSRFLLAGLLCAGSGAALAQTTQHYTDATGEVAVGNFPHLDISSVDVTVDAAATNIAFKINLQGSPVDTNWGKYMIGIRSGVGGTTSGNGWGRPISMAGGMTHWIGCWVDGTMGAEVRSYSGAWSGPQVATVTKDATSVTITTTVSSLSLAPGEVFSFDVYASGGNNGDTAVEALSAATTSSANWNGSYTTNAVGGSPNPARTFTMPGSPDYATWIATYGLFDNDALPGTDYDQDGLTNQQEFDLGIGLDPSLDDSDADGLKDGVENLTGVYVDATHTGSNPMDLDSDNDGVTDGDEVLLDPEDPQDYVRDPNNFNYAKITVPGSFNTPGNWNAAGDSVPSNTMTVAGQGLAQQFQWTLDCRFPTPKVSFEQKFAIGAWDTSWGSGPDANTAALNGGGNIVRTVAASGIHRFTFNTATRAHSFTRVTFPDVASYLAAYGLAAGADQDGDGLNNEAEFTKNSDPYNADTDGDGLNDSVDPDPVVVAPESRQILFQVNMSVMTGQGSFTPGTSVVRVIGQFEGWDVNAGVVLADPDHDGIYTGTYAAAGFAGSSFGGYKFFINGGPGGGYENGGDRTFDLGAANVQQVLPVVYFGNIQPPGGYDAWIATYPGLSDTSRAGDPDQDGLSNGQEFLFGTSPASGSGAFLLSVSQGQGGMVLRWLQRSAGATYTLQENEDLAGEWTTSPVTPAAAADQTGVPADYVRMEAVVPVVGLRNMVRMNGVEN